MGKQKSSWKKLKMVVPLLDGPMGFIRVFGKCFRTEKWQQLYGPKLGLYKVGLRIIPGRTQVVSNPQ